MRIEVTQEHIDRGIRHAPCGCPVALAMSSAGLYQPTVSTYGSSVGYARSCVRHPSEVSDFIMDFDRGLPVGPFTFDLDIPQEAIQC